jgi:thiol:disulfide interchange protein
VRASGKPVFVDFTAAWCVTCQLNKRVTLSDSGLAAAFRERQVVLMRADWTRRDPAVTDALRALGRSGVPVYALYGPGAGEPQLLSEILTVSEIRDAMARWPAAGARDTAALQPRLP